MPCRGELKQRAWRTYRARATAPTYPNPPRFKLRPLPPSPGPLYAHRAAASGNPGLAASQWPRAGRPLCPSDNQWRGGAEPAARRGERDRPRPHLKRQVGMKVGVLSVMSPAAWRLLSPHGEGGLCWGWGSVESPAGEALPRVTPLFSRDSVSPGPAPASSLACVLRSLRSRRTAGEAFFPQWS